MRRLGTVGTRVPLLTSPGMSEGDAAQSASTSPFREEEKSFFTFAQRPLRFSGPTCISAERVAVERSEPPDGPRIGHPGAHPASPPWRRRDGDGRDPMDAQTGMPSVRASGATCVQKLDDSRNSAIHTRYRISLRSSSLQEPRYPLLRVHSFDIFCLSTCVPR